MHHKKSLALLCVAPSHLNTKGIPVISFWKAHRNVCFPSAIRMLQKFWAQVSTVLLTSVQKASERICFVWWYVPRAYLSAHGSWVLKSDYTCQSDSRGGGRLPCPLFVHVGRKVMKKEDSSSLVLLLGKRFIWNCLLLGFPWWEFICLPLPFGSCEFFPMPLLKETLISKPAKFL